MNPRLPGKVCTAARCLDSVHLQLVLQSAGSRNITSEFLNRQLALYQVRKKMTYPFERPVIAVWYVIT
jgi:hypothetical protein